MGKLQMKTAFYVLKVNFSLKIFSLIIARFLKTRKTFGKNIFHGNAYCDRQDYFFELKVFSLTYECTRKIRI